jgi:hypothetical protein
MHVIVTRQALLDGDPALAPALMAEFEEAKRCAVQRIRDLTASRAPVPMVAEQALDASSVFGADPFPYGATPDRVMLAALCSTAPSKE